MVDKHFISILLVCSSVLAYAQSTFTIYNDGMSIVEIGSGITATIDGSYISQNKGSDGQIDNQGLIEVTGDWINNNSSSNAFSTQEGTVELLGSSEQTIGGYRGTEFHDLTINNTSSSGKLTLSNTIDLTGTLTLTDGKIMTSSGNVLTISQGAGSSQGSSSSFVDGPMRKEGTTAFVFPLGDGDRYARLALGSPTSSTTYEAEYVNGGYSNTTSMASSPTPVLNNVSKNEYWEISRVVGTGDASVTLYWENATTSDMNDCNDLKIAHWNGLAWENNHDSNTSLSGTCSGTGSGAISTTNHVSSFSPFTFGSKSPVVNPLPIELLYFDAKLIDNSVFLNWSTASEANNDFFTISRSRDGVNFEYVTNIIGAGNSSTMQEYSAVDEDPLEGGSYYRLRQTDFDGIYEYSGLVYVNYVKDVEVRIFPNPFNESLNLDLGQFESDVQVSVFDLRGIEIMKWGASVSSNTDIIKLETGELTPGVYIIYVHADNERGRFRVVKHR